MARRIDRIFDALKSTTSYEPVNEKNNNYDLSKAIQDAEIIFSDAAGEDYSAVGNVDSVEAQSASECNSEFVDAQISDFVVDGEVRMMMEDASDEAVAPIQLSIVEIGQRDSIFDEIPFCSGVQSTIIENLTVEDCESSDLDESDHTPCTKLSDKILEDEGPRRKRSTKNFGNTLGQKRGFSNRFFLGKDRLRVCRTMFLNTLGVKEWVIKKWAKSNLENGYRKDEDNVQPNKIRDSTTAPTRSLHDFFDCLPKLESHYCRASTSKLYLEPTWNSKAHLYKIYKSDYCTTHNVEPVSIATFHKEFDKKRLSLYKPKKDLCDTCVAFETGNLTEDKYNEHIAFKNAARTAKTVDKESPNEVFTMDLQSVLLSPKSNTPGRSAGAPLVNDIRALRYSHEGVFFKLNHSDQKWQILPVRLNTKTNNATNDANDLPKLYRNRIKIKAEKYKHLQSLKATMEFDYHAFYIYDNLPHD
ncbi:unnamed protein product [Acanthoscelides obtectus]|uniref:Uncharacterized protein n=1 Tax=Acanthoscelides obtectus TaxID=200917 RepID=A0A9P0L787_ACAOB|nr:unnamed protein product [Acanthoscelides obtectus]CAK1671772.1 hypothetical protein AOBTE_LOCUS28453 [Acanthoscelides obtectus]